MTVYHKVPAVRLMCPFSIIVNAWAVKVVVDETTRSANTETLRRHRLMIPIARHVDLVAKSAPRNCYRRLRSDSH